MQGNGFVGKSIIASIALASLTLGVFARSQLRGPEGTINRYFEAILRRDIPTAGQLCVGTDIQFFFMTRDFLKLFSVGATYQIIDVVRSGETARAGVVFTSPQFPRLFNQNSEDLPSIIFLKRVDKAWKIDIDRTLQPYRLPE